MRRVLLVMVVLSGMLACKKSGQVSPKPVSAGLFGKWELRKEYGGFSFRDSDYKAGNGNIYQFNSDSSYQYYLKGKLNRQGVFHIISHYVESGDLFKEILIDNEGYRPFSMDGTSLTIGTSANDDIADDYQKIQDQ
jgi:hypothetical protein